MSGMDFFTNIALHNNEIQGVVIETLSAQPSKADSKVGRVYYDTTGNALFVCTAVGAESATWTELAQGGDVSGITTRVTNIESFIGLTSEGTETVPASGLAAEIDTLNAKFTGAVASATATKVTVTGGIVTGTSTLAASDIPDISATYMTQTQIDASTITSSATQVPSSAAVTTALAGKVNTEAGKGLSTNDFTDALLTKLNGIEAGAEVNDVTDVQTKTSASGSYATVLDGTVAKIDLSGYALKTDISSALNFKGTVATYDALLAVPSPATGDVYNVTGQAVVPSGPHAGTYPPGTNFAYTGTVWDPLGGSTAGYVPDTRTINTKALSSNITLTAADVGAIATTAIDTASLSASDSNVPSSKLVNTELSGKMAKFSTSPTGGKVVVTVDGDDDAVVESSSTIGGATTPIYLNGGELVAGTAIGTAGYLAKTVQGSTSGSVFGASSADTNVPTDLAVKTALDLKVDKVDGMGLSQNSYTTAEKTKLEGIATGAQVNAIESVTLNGTAATITNKVAALTMSTDLKDYSNTTTKFQNDSQVASAISTAIAPYALTTDVAGAFTEPALTAASTPTTGYNYTYTASGPSGYTIWEAQLLTSAGKVIYADVTIGATSVTVDAMAELPTGAKVRLICKKNSA